MKPCNTALQFGSRMECAFPSLVWGNIWLWIGRLSHCYLTIIYCLVWEIGVSQWFWLFAMCNVYVLYHSGNGLSTGFVIWRCWVWFWPTLSFCIMPGFQHFVSVHPYPFPYSVSALPFHSAVAVSVPCTHHGLNGYGKNRSQSYLNGWTEMASLWKQRTLFLYVSYGILTEFLWINIIVMYFWNGTRRYGCGWTKTNAGNQT